MTTRIKGTKSDDVLTAYNQPDNFKLVGRAGDDVLVGNGNTALKGGKGHDVFVINVGDVILDFDRSEDTLVILPVIHEPVQFFQNPDDGTSYILPLV